MWNEGYFTEGTYTYGYYRELSPVWQRFCLLATFGVIKYSYQAEDENVE